MSRPRLLDLFCGAGGAAMGYHRAGFEVVGVDIAPQPNYPFEFHQMDALEALETAERYGPWPWWDPFDPSTDAGFDAIHASPICQGNTPLRFISGKEYADLLAPTRDLLVRQSVPWVIENVPGASMRRDVVLCGSQFGLGVRRHRWFELSWPLFDLMPPCRHDYKPVDVTGTGGPATKERSHGGGIHRKPRDLAHAREVMGIDWMTRKELSQAIPPAYTEFIGSQLLAHLGVAA